MQPINFLLSHVGIGKPPSPTKAASQHSQTAPPGQNLGDGFIPAEKQEQIFPLKDFQLELNQFRQGTSAAFDHKSGEPWTALELAAADISHIQEEEARLAEQLQERGDLEGVQRHTCKVLDPVIVVQTRVSLNPEGEVKESELDEFWAYPSGFAGLGQKTVHVKYQHFQDGQGRDHYLVGDGLPDKSNYDRTEYILDPKSGTFAVLSSNP